MVSGRPRLTAIVVGALAASFAVRPVVAQDAPWTPAPAPVEPAPPPEEGGGVGLQILAGVGIGAAAVGAMLAADQADHSAGVVAVWSLAAVTPAAAGLAICNLGRRSERSEPSCPRAVFAAYIGSLIALPVLFIGFLALVDWGPSPDKAEEDRKTLLLTSATGLAWVGGMTAAATIFGRRRLRRPVVGVAPSAARGPGRFAPADDPRQPRWVGTPLSGQVLFRVVSVEF